MRTQKRIDYEKDYYAREYEAIHRFSNIKDNKTAQRLVSLI